MKITKRQLRRIIREEKRRILNEIGPSRPIPNPKMKSPGQDTPGEKGMKSQFAAKKLQTALANLQDLAVSLLTAKSFTKIERFGFSLINNSKTFETL